MNPAPRLVKENRQAVVWRAPIRLSPADARNSLGHVAGFDTLAAT